MIHEDWLPEYVKRRPKVIQKLKDSYDNYRQLASVLQLTCELYGLHQTQAALIMDMNQSDISKLEKGSYDPSFYEFVKYAHILGYDVRFVSKEGDEDELSLFHIRRHNIARTVPSDLEIASYFPFYDIEEDVIKERASVMIQCLAELRARKETGLSMLYQEYIKVRRKPPELEIPDFSIKQMAKELGVSHMTIRRFEQGDLDSAKTSMVFRYAERFNLWLTLFENKSNSGEKSWERFILTYGKLHKVLETILDKGKDDGM